MDERDAFRGLDPATDLPEIGFSAQVATGGGPVPLAARGRDTTMLPLGSGGYELLSELATGGMAELYLARRRGLASIDQVVVVKRLRAEALANPIVVKMFLWEAWISSRLRHPNIVRFHDFSRHRHEYFLVLEYVSGCDLMKVLRAQLTARRPMPLGAALEVGVGITRALAHAHRLCDGEGRPVGLIHRDVSPQNVLLSADGEVKLTDFGIAKTTSTFIPRETAVGLVKGKVAYLAPEQLRGKPLDARSDIFSAGIVLYELLAGERLFLRSDDASTLGAVLEANPPPLRALRPDCPPRLAEAVHRALAREPDERFADALKLCRLLEEIRGEVGGEPGSRQLARLVRACADPPPISVLSTRDGERSHALLRSVSPRDGAGEALAELFDELDATLARDPSPPAPRTPEVPDLQPLPVERGAATRSDVPAARAGTREGSEARASSRSAIDAPRPEGAGAFSAGRLARRLARAALVAAAAFVLGAGASFAALRLDEAVRRANPVRAAEPPAGCACAGPLGAAPR